MKNLSLVSLIILSCLYITFLTGCTENREINEHAYVIAIGVDESENDHNKIMVTFEFVIPIGFNSEGESEVSSTTTVEANSLQSALSLVNTYISKKLNISHTKLLVFSEKIAKKGLNEYIYTIDNDKNYRTNLYMVISKCSAKEYIDNTNPELEKNPAKFYESLFNGYTYTSYIANSFFLGYVLASKSNAGEPVALLGNINTSSTKDNNTESLIGINDEKKIAGEIIRKPNDGTEILGLAIFKNNQLIGELTAEDTVYFQMLNNKFNKINYSIYDPFMPNYIISFKITKKDNTKTNISFINNKPFIENEISLLANIISINEYVDYSQPDNLNTLEEYFEYVLNNNIQEFLYDTSKIYKTDLVGFGKYATKNYFTIKKWNEANWLDMYQYAYFSTKVNVTIEKSGLTFTK